MKIINDMKQYSPREWCYLLILIGVVVAVGMFATNQYLEFRYNAELLSTPCDLCRILNPKVESCFHETIEVQNNVGYPEVDISLIEDSLITP